MADLPFIKMHGLGNDFVVIDARAHPVDLTADQVRTLSDRHRGIGFDQIMVIKRSNKADAELHMANADGATVGACGNGTRCVAALLLEEFQQDTIMLDTSSGLISASAAPNGLTTVDMGPARTTWLEIPTARAEDTLHLDLTHETAAGQLSDPVGVNMGNPHAVFFVEDIAHYDLGSFGREIECHALFPERANISLAQVKGDTINLVVWERGVGLTLACGTAACAALVAAARRNLCGRSADVHLPGGTLQITWREDNHVLMTGPVATSFLGTVDLDHLIETAL